MQYCLRIAVSKGGSTWANAGVSHKKAQKTQKELMSFLCLFVAVFILIIVLLPISLSIRLNSVLVWLDALRERRPPPNSMAYVPLYLLRQASRLWTRGIR